MLSLILFVFMIGFMLAFFAIALLSVNGSVSPDAMTFSGVALLAIMTVGFLVITMVYRKRTRDFDTKYNEWMLQLQRLFQENTALVKFIAAWLLFTAGAAFAQYLFFDFSDLSPDETENTALIILHLAGIAVLSALNVYYIPGFVRRLGKDKNRRQFFAALIGFFGLVLGAPIITAPLGAGTAMFTIFTGIHIVIQSARKDT